MAQQHQVAIVLTEDFGDRLIDLSKQMHVWIVNTPANRSVAQRIWIESPGHSLERGVTTMNISSQATPEEIFSEMLDAIEVHHGVWSHDPAWTSIHVYGIEPGNAVFNALAAYGANEITRNTDYFTATRSVPTEEAKE